MFYLDARLNEQPQPEKKYNPDFANNLLLNKTGSSYLPVLQNYYNVLIFGLLCSNKNRKLITLPIFIKTAVVKSFNLKVQ